MKLAVIGGAGVRMVFLARGVAARARETGIDTLVLYDIDVQRLSLMAPLCRRAAELEDPTLAVLAEPDLDKALSGAGAVITTFRVGGDHSRVLDEELAAKFGLLPQETTGVGGFFMACRTIPVLAKYCARIQEVAPTAMVFNFANPSGLVTQAMNLAGFGNVIGICDTPSSTNLRIAAELGMDVGNLDFRWAGLNHLSWIFSIFHNGEDILPELIARDDFLKGVPEFSMFEPELIRSLGCLPNEYLYYYYYREKAVANIRKGTATRGAFIEANNFALFEALAAVDPERNPDRGLALHARFMRKRESSYMSLETGSQKAATNQTAPIPEGRDAGTGEVQDSTHDAAQDAAQDGAQDAAQDGVGYAKVVLDYLSARATGAESKMVLSVPSRGVLPFLRSEDVAEISCTTAGSALRPLDPGRVPEHAALLCAQVKLFERHAAAAALEGSRSSAIEALMAHPLIGSYSLATALVDEGFVGD